MRIIFPGLKRDCGIETGLGLKRDCGIETGLGLKRDSTSPIPRVPDFPGLGLTFENGAGTRGIGTHFRKLAGIAGLRKWKMSPEKHPWI